MLRQLRLSDSHLFDGKIGAQKLKLRLEDVFYALGTHNLEKIDSNIEVKRNV